MVVNTAAERLFGIDTKFGETLVKSLLKTVAAIALITPIATSADFDTGTTESWTKAGQDAIKERLADKPNTKRAKNVILFVGDGMGISTLTAARILEGQLAGQPGEENFLSFEKFPHTALVKTYNVDSQVADSAGTASALNTGVKTRIGVINTAPTHMQATCDNIADNLVTPLAYKAEAAGMATGIVSTARLTHATPAAVYAHSPLREWETDADMPTKAIEAGCRDIGQQIIDKIGGDGLEVALGGGRRSFKPVSEGGKRKDGRDLTKEWVSTFNNAAYIETAAELKSVEADHLLGLFSSSHMSFEAQRDGTEEPTLTEMTEAAIKALSKDEDGYYLMVEAGRVDHGHHGGSAYLALHDAVELSRAVKRTLELVDTEETLILVTADHSHVFTMAGYPVRGNPIFGLVNSLNRDENGEIKQELTLAKDGKPYTTLGYHNGSGAVKGERPHLTAEEVAKPDFKQQALVPTRSETHGGEDVGLFAIGPWSHLAKGTMEQNVVYHIMHHALDLDNRNK
ncbi:alkaline phosphatase [Kordiimonas sediminis]